MDFEPVAKLVVSDPPAWLAEHFLEWSYSVFMGRAVEGHQPSRSQMRKILSEVSDAASLLLRAIDETSVREFLKTPSKGPLMTHGPLQRLLVDLRARAIESSQSPALVSDKGSTRAGTGKAMPAEALPAQAFCALFIAETIRHFTGAYPAPRNRRAAEAAERYWELAGGNRLSWGNDPLAAWRRHFKKALSSETAGLPESTTLREEFRRHLSIRERLAKASADDGTAGT